MYNKIELFIEKHERLCVCTTILVSFLLLTCTFWTTYPLHTTTDELGAIVGAAKIAGYDWSGVIGRSGYYGFGYYALFFPLFMLKLSPILIYRIILIVTRFLRCVIIIGSSYYIGSKYVKFKSKFLLLTISFICSIPLHLLNVPTIVNDIVIDAFFWIILLFMCKIIECVDQKRRCVGYIVCWLFFSIWSMLLHTRSIVMVIATFIVIAWVGILKKKKEILAVLCIIPCAVLANQVIHLYQNNIWTSAATAGLNNASVSVSFLPLNDLQTWEIWFDIFIGHLTTQMLLTAGFFLFSFIICITNLYKAIRYRKVNNIYASAILISTLLCVGTVFGAFLVSHWSKNLYSIWNNPETSNTYFYKGLCYVRYWSAFSSPILFLGAYFEEISTRKKRNIWITIIFGIVIILFFIYLVVPRIETNGSAASFFFSFLTETEEYKNISVNFWYKCIKICILVALCSIIIIFCFKWKSLATIPLIVFMSIGYYHANIYYSECIRDEISSMVLSSYYKKCELDANGIELGKIYVFDDRNRESNWKMDSVLQFYFYEYKIENTYPEELNSNDIIITYGRNNRIESDFKNIRCYELDDNEVWYTYMNLEK